MVSSEADILIKNRFCLPMHQIVQLICNRGSLEGAMEIIIGTKTDLVFLQCV